ncbi:hypothetical protein BHE74_00036007 [Ensete ventricosum]|nr:hypothetical protein BHE74_00036007 [Ensete ventricosum]
MAMPPTRVAGHGQGPCRGDRVQLGPPARATARKGATANRHSRLWGQRQPAREAPAGTAPAGAAARGAATLVRSLGQWCLPQRGSPWARRPLD